MVARARVRAVPAPCRTPRAGRGLALRRRAADARDRPRPDGQSARAADGRAVRRARAADRRRGRPHDCATEGRRPLHRAGRAEHQAHARPCGRRGDREYRRGGVFRHRGGNAHQRQGHRAASGACSDQRGARKRDRHQSLRPDRRAPAGQARPRDPAEVHNNRHPFACRRAGRRAIAQPHLDMSTVPLGHFATPTSRRSTPSRRPTAARA